MVAENFRIGNWVFDDDGTAFQIERLEKGMVVDHALMVPLTVEWLLKLGFKERNDGLEMRVKGFDIRFETDVLEGFLECIGIDIVYVHQLQNLYHVLSGGEELL